jgi:hypothetical protein
MPQSAVQYLVEDLDGTRMIRILFPKTIVPTTLAEGYATYLALWEVDTPTVAIADVRRLESLPAAARSAITVLLRRVVINPSFVGSAWVCGDNPLIVDIRELLVEGGRDPETAFADEQQAVAYLRECIAAWRPAEEG